MPFVPRRHMNRSEVPPVLSVEPGTSIPQWGYCCWSPVLAAEGCFEPPNLGGTSNRRRAILEQAPDLNAWADQLAQEWYGKPTFRGLTDAARRNRIICGMMHSSPRAYRVLFELRMAAVQSGTVVSSTTLGVIAGVVAALPFPGAAAVGAAIGAGAALIGVGGNAQVNRIAERLALLAQGQLTNAPSNAPTPQEVCAIARALLDGGGQALGDSGLTEIDPSGAAAAEAGLSAAAEMLALCEQGGEELTICDVLRQLVAAGEVIIEQLPDGTKEAKPTNRAGDAAMSVLRGLTPQLLALCDVAVGGSAPDDSSGGGSGSRPGMGNLRGPVSPANNNNGGLVPLLALGAVARWLL